MDTTKMHEKDYQKDAYLDYTIEELAAWIHLLIKRASMRTDNTKRDKDLADAENYSVLLKAKIEKDIQRVKTH